MDITQFTNEQWLLDDFVQRVNSLLPIFMDKEKCLGEKYHGKLTEEINLRLVRYYTSSGMLEEPLKQGKYALYTYRHLLQILVIRILMAEGLGTMAIGDLVLKKSNKELESLLWCGIGIEIVPNVSKNRALAFLEQIGPTSSVLEDHVVSRNKPSCSTNYQEVSHWYHVVIEPGLEIHICSDFKEPLSSKGMDKLIQNIGIIIKSIFERKKYDRTNH